MERHGHTRLARAFCRKLRRTVRLAALPLVLAACGGQSIILVADPSGHVGQAEVATAAGTQRLEKPGDMTQTSGAAKPPSAVTTADPSYIATTFAEALAIEPPPPQVFTLMFESGTTQLTAASLDQIPEIVAASQKRPAISIRISGHTDATGSGKVNDALSLERAMQVRNLLEHKGIPARLMSVTSHGKGNPAIPTPDGVAEPRNRRVVVIVH